MHWAHGLCHLWTDRREPIWILQSAIPSSPANSTPAEQSSFEVLRVGMDFKIRCTGCGREVMLPRAKIEKNIKKVIRPGQE